MRPFRPNLTSPACSLPSIIAYSFRDCKVQTGSERSFDAIFLFAFFTATQSRIHISVNLYINIHFHAAYCKNRELCAFWPVFVLHNYFTFESANTLPTKRIAAGEVCLRALFVPERRKNSIFSATPSAASDLSRPHRIPRFSAVGTGPAGFHPPSQMQPPPRICPQCADTRPPRQSVGSRKPQPPGSVSSY